MPLARAAVANLQGAAIALPQNEQGQPVPIPNTADSGYFSAENIRAVTDLGLDPYYATGRQKHHAPAESVAGDEPLPAETAERAAPQSECTSAKEAMLAKLRSERGRLLYAARKYIVEPVFGQIKRVRWFRKFLLRGLEKISAEWQLICLTHNLLKIWRHASSGV